MIIYCNKVTFNLWVSISPQTGCFLHAFLVIVVDDCVGLVIWYGCSLQTIFFVICSAFVTLMCFVNVWLFLEIGKDERFRALRKKQSTKQQIETTDQKMESFEGPSHLEVAPIADEKLSFHSLRYPPTFWLLYYPSNDSASVGPNYCGPSPRRISWCKIVRHPMSLVRLCSWDFY